MSSTLRELTRKFALCCVFFLLPIQVSNALTVTVDTTGDAAVATSFRQAIIDINGAGAGPHTIDFEDGVGQAFENLVTITVGSSMNIQEDVTINFPTAGLTLDGGGNNIQIFLISNNADVTFNGGANQLTIQNNGTYDGDGGAFYVGGGSSLALSDVDINSIDVITSNRNGGGIYSEATLTLTDCTINGCDAYRGGAIYCKQNTTITSCNIGSTTKNTSNDVGGGIYFYPNGAYILRVETGSIIETNEAGGNGGGIYYDATTSSSHKVIINNSTVSSNTGYSGGGIYSNGSNGETRIENNSIMDENDASDEDGGAIYSNNNTIIDDSLIGGASGNTAFDLGGGICFDPAAANTITIQNEAIISTNSSIDGAGLFYYCDLNAAHSATINEATFESNTAFAVGGGIVTSDQYGSLTITDSRFDDNVAFFEDGGAIFSMNETLIDNSIIGDTIGNGAWQFGGGICFAPEVAKTLTIQNNTSFTNNFAVAGGGLFYYNVYDTAHSITIDNCDFDTNEADVASDGVGGGICTLDQYGSITITNSNFDGNKAFDGGSIFSMSDVTISSSAFGMSSADGLDGFGGAICYVPAGPTTMQIDNGSYIAYNTALRGGAIYYEASLDDAAAGGPNALLISDSIIDDNTATHAAGIYYEGISGSLTINKSNMARNISSATDGGAIYTAGNFTKLINSTLSGNESPTKGGGILFDGTTLELYGCTIADNSAAAGGGIYLSTGALEVFENTIVADSPSGNDIQDSGSHITLANAAYNLIEDPNGGHGITNGFNHNIVGSDPYLGPLMENGGITYTRALQSLSPAIDNGDTIPELNGVDQRGTARPIGSAYDIGAFEFYSPRIIGHGCSTHL
jgi:predicted outer membrane repeat protein